METFLNIVAKDIYTKIGNDLSKVAIVFPNKRASLFFNEFLADQSENPIWSPAYLSISELFQQLSVLKLADSVTLVCELYKVFIEETKSSETLDEFYFWGELLISDFDDADKNMVDTEKLFSNLQELKNIMSGYDYLDKEQEEAIQAFFQNFSIERRTQLKEKFISLWDKLGNVYNQFTYSLRTAGIAYEGLLYRDVIQTIKSESFKYDKYVFVGFNVLNKVESSLFETLQADNKAMFYWDFDVYYTQTTGFKHEAGEFINRNIQRFQSELKGQYFDNLRKPKNIKFISSPTENAQARFLPEWISEVYSNNERENAVVLCNETLLLPVLHSIPKHVNNLNITMGFPLSQTPVYSFIDALIDLQIIGYKHKEGCFIYDAVLAVLKHPYTRMLSANAKDLERSILERNKFYPLPSELRKDEILDLIFTPCSNLYSLCQYLKELISVAASLYREKEGSTDDIFNQLYRESLFKSYTSINRISNLIENGKLDVRVDTFRKLINKILSSLNIPFHGEPAIGMQIMGVLETRNLDFKNLIIMSLNEGQLPKSGGDASFIPYNLRKAFGMTIIEHKNAVYAYYFYRLIQRAENVTLLYNNSSDSLNKGEWSRFMLQLLLEWPNEIKKEYIESGQSPQTIESITVNKSPDLLLELEYKFDTSYNNSALLSPSALNTYLDCPLKFYYQYVVGLNRPNKVSSEIDAAQFGSIFHLSAQKTYEYLTSRDDLITKDILESLIKKDVKLQSYVDFAFNNILFKSNDDLKPEYNGQQLINSKVIVSYLKQLLRNDIQYAPFQMIAMEKFISEDFPIIINGKKLNLRFGGIIDRIDRKEDTLRIVDYKTGGTPETPANLEALFTPSKKRPSHIFQTFLYASIQCKKESLKVAPSLLYIHHASSETYSPIIEIGEPRKAKIPVSDFSIYEEKFRDRLSLLIKEIFNPEIPFTQTKDIDFCEYCDFKTLCKK